MNEETLSQVFTHLEQVMTPEDIANVKGMSEGQLISLHFGLAMYIRNEFIHPRDSIIRKKLSAIGYIMHHDTMGSLVLKAFWHHLNGRLTPAKLQEMMGLPEGSDDVVADLLGEI